MAIFDLSVMQGLRSTFHLWLRVMDSPVTDAALCFYHSAVSWKVTPEEMGYSFLLPMKLSRHTMFEI
jgi:hypothetical protein